jgi:hypothetical protein
MWKPWFLVAAGALLYANSLSTPFVFDDLIWITMTLRSLGCCDFPPCRIFSA